MFFVQIGIFLCLLGAGYFIGHYREAKHFRVLAQREKELGSILTSTLKRLPPSQSAQTIGLVSGSTVIATDYFKIFLSSLRNLFGGEMKSYETLINRGRREAHVRMLTEASNSGATAVINIRYQTSTIGGKRKNGGIEVIAYGTALKQCNSPESSNA
jgi:uncharacterized protein YbjQ (UPF0145 family)